MESDELEMNKVQVNDFEGSPFATHNMPCSVCWKEKAVLNLGTGVFSPCRKCQGKGYLLVKFTPFQKPHY